MLYLFLPIPRKHIILKTSFHKPNMKCKWWDKNVKYYPKRLEGTIGKASLRKQFLKFAQEQPNKHRRNRPNTYENCGTLIDRPFQINT